MFYHWRGSLYLSEYEYLVSFCLMSGSIAWKSIESVLNYVCFIVISKAWSGKASHSSISQTLFSMEHEGRLQEQIYFKNKIKWKCTESIRMKRKASDWLSHQTNTICMLHWARQKYVTVCCLHYCGYMCRKVSEPEDEINKPRCSGIACLEGCLVAWILF